MPSFSPSPFSQVLLRRTKNNPVLIGDPGVGKTAVAEGIAQLIVSPAAPPGLAGRALIALDVGSLVSGTQYRGAFEERITVGGRAGGRAGGWMPPFVGLSVAREGQDEGCSARHLPACQHPPLPPAPWPFFSRHPPTHPSIPPLRCPAHSPC